jgi:hypothetical protein
MTDVSDQVVAEALGRAEDQWRVRGLLGLASLSASARAGTGPLTERAVDGATTDVDGRIVPARDGAAPHLAHEASPWYVHTLGPARVDLHHDRAVSTHYERIHGASVDGGVDLLGFGYGRWDLVRAADGWRLEHSRVRSTGRSDSMDVLREELPAVLDRADEPTVRAPGHSAGARVQRLLDHFAIANVVATYGIAADGGAAKHVGDQYTIDTDVDIEGEMFMRGRGEVEAMIEDAPHQSLLPWAGHTMGPALVDIDGDTATATLYARIYGRISGASNEMADPRAIGDRALWRFGYNRWHLVRDVDGRWRIATRVSRSPRHPDARALLRQAVTAGDPPPPPPTSPSGLEQRLAAIEDSLAVDQAVTMVTMALDAHDPHAVRSLYADDVTITVDGTDRVLPDLESTAAAESVIGHLVGPGSVSVRGDDASSTQLMGVYERPKGSPSRLARLAWHRWELRRGAAGGWTITREESWRAGSAGAEALVARAIDESRVTGA